MASDCASQQIARWSSFYENGFVWNPALTGRWSYWEFSATHRAEWTGFEDAPQYSTVGYQFPFLRRQTRVALGAFAEVDRVGPYQNISFSGSYAYKIRPQWFGNRRDVLTLGMSGKFQQISIDSRRLVHPGLLEGDIATLEESTRLLPNVGAGLFYISVNDEGAHNQKNHYYVGLSLLNLVPLDQADYNGLALTTVPHATLNVGYRYYPWRASHFIETNALAVYAFSRAINIMTNVRYEKINKYWMTLGVVTSGDFFGQVGVIFDEDSMLKKIVKDGSLRLGIKAEYSIGSIVQVAGMGYEAYIAYRFEME